MLAPAKHIIPVTLIQRQRLLPVPGRITVRKGQKVSPTDIVGEAYPAPEHILLDISLGLGVSTEEADSYIQRQTGDSVDENDVLAGPVGVGKRVVRAPKKGKVVLAGGGQILLELDGRPYELRAGFSGVIRELLPDQGVIVETTGALIQGSWGNGRADYGLLHVLARSAEEELHPDRLDVSLRGAVIIGGHCEQADVLSIAEELPLRGLILASMKSELVPQANRMRCPVILTEGFGHLPMNENAYKLLSTSQRREVSVLAERWDPNLGTRPEIIIPLPTEAGAPIPLDTGELKVGQLVRVTHSLYQGKIGQIVDVLADNVNLPSGITAAAAQVSFHGEAPVTLPLVNLEILRTQ
jgi:hypothetical protein